MQWAFILVICIIAISVIVIAMVRTCLKNKSKELAEKLNHISAYSEKSNYEQARERLSALNERAFIDIPSDLNNGFFRSIGINAILDTGSQEFGHIFYNIHLDTSLDSRLYFYQ